ncbi:hypothetical protein DFH09DRAFT_1086138 [Mycena vulgaris]|nr:hypothetical protein DFH09DRAFT_1086138 [Mycena vulgaris]
MTQSGSGAEQQYELARQRLKLDEKAQLIVMYRLGIFTKNKFIARLEKIEAHYEVATRPPPAKRPPMGWLEPWYLAYNFRLPGQVCVRMEPPSAVRVATPRIIQRILKSQQRSKLRKIFVVRFFPSALGGLRDPSVDRGGWEHRRCRPDVWHILHINVPAIRTVSC